MHSHRENLLEGDIAPHMWRLAVPMMWGLFAMTSFGIVDTLYISRLGTTALAALGFTMPMVMFYMGIIFGLSIGTTSVLSRAYGEGDFDKVRRLATDSLVMATIIIASAAMAGYCLINDIFRLMGAKPDLMPLIHRFMAIWYCGMTFTGMMFVCNACIRAGGNTRLPSSLMTLASVLNICIDPFLIYGWGPFPKMGFAGAALTLVISYTVAGCSGLYFLIMRKKLICFPLVYPGMMASWKKLLHVGAPSIISNLISPISAGVVTWMAADLGTEAVAALGVSTRIEGLAAMIFYALGAGVSIFTGQNFGAGNYGRVNDMSALATRYTLLWSVFTAVVLWVFADRVPLLFDTHPLVISYTAQYMRIVPVSYGAMGVMIISNAVLNAMGKPLPATMLILLRCIVLYIPLAYILQRHYGFLGILIALTITNFVVGILSHLWNKIATP